MPANQIASSDTSKLQQSRSARLHYDNGNKSEPQQRNPRFLLFLLIGFCLLFIVSYTSRLIEYSRSQEVLGQWSQRIDQANERQSKLVAQREFVYSDDYVDKIAREDLGLAKPGDHIIVIIPDAETSQTEAAQAGMGTVPKNFTPASLPIWQQWLGLFKQNSFTSFSL